MEIAGDVNELERGYVIGEVFAMNTAVPRQSLLSQTGKADLQPLALYDFGFLFSTWGELGIMGDSAIS